MNQEIQPNDTQFLLYQTPDGGIRIETRMQNESVWLPKSKWLSFLISQNQLLTTHEKYISDGELIENST